MAKISTGWGPSIAPISLRRYSENHISPSGKYPPGKFNFSFIPSPTDIRNTGADYKALLQHNKYHYNLFNNFNFIKQTFIYG